MVKKDDKRIIEEVLSGDTNAFGVLVERYQQSIFRMIFRMTGSRVEAEELTQNVFVKAYSNLTQFNPKYKFFSWLYRIAINESLNYLKSRKNISAIDVNTSVTHENPEVILHKKERKEALQLAIMELSARERRLIVLKYYEEMTYEEISNVTGLSVKKVKSRLF
ncbi:MAG: sigma-70 family RNA polymerase sigma factor, partial [Bacteroidales bacterium]|nr:sigma-70 family RNA polymerase sigma factor [Bacteroidales bacterium]